MTKQLFKYLFLLMATTSFAACSSSDNDDTPTAPVLSETAVNVDYDVTFYSVNVSSRAVWSATVESGSDWLKLTSAKGVGGTSEKLSFEMTRNTTKSPRVARIKVSSGTASSSLEVTQAPSTIEIMDASQVKDFNKYYKPAEFGSIDMLRSDAKWSWFRSKQSEHFFVFWDAYFGDDPNSSSLPEGDRVDVDDLLKKAEQFYTTNITRLGMVVTGEGKSQLDNYKMEIYLLDPTPEWWVATGSGYDNMIGALWVTPATCKPVGSVIAHEIGHSFQYQVSCDKLLTGEGHETDYGMDCGFRYGFGPNGRGGCAYWEQCAQWQSFQDYPEVTFSDSFYAWQQNFHRHFNHEWMRYASVYFQFYMTQKHGIKAYGRIWNESKFPEDPLQTYMRLFCNNDLQTFYADYAEYAQKVLTYDLGDIQKYADDNAKAFKTQMFEVDGKFRPAYSACPGTTGFNAIQLNVPEAGTIVKASLTALAPGSALAADDPGEMKNGDNQVVKNVKAYNSQSNKDACYRFGFVAIKNGKALEYGALTKGAEGDATMTVPAGTDKLYLVVVATPDTYNRHEWNDDESDDEQWPYEVSFSGTNVSGHINIDEGAEPQNVELSLDVKCDASNGDWVLGSIDLTGNGSLEKIATAFALQPATLAGATLPIAANTTQAPAEGKIALGLLQPDGTIAYSYTANVGFYCKADGSLGSWGDGDPVWFEYDKDNFILTYGHYPAKTESGKKYVVKPVLVYTKGGKQYTATITLNMQF
ncbi:MAG: DUF4859 domain-containing protein [Prevotella sp.]|nr:DUF4859 domain-containing protein [Prevotella sp.]